MDWKLWKLPRLFRSRAFVEHRRGVERTLQEAEWQVFLFRNLRSCVMVGPIQVVVVRIWYLDVKSKCVSSEYQDSDVSRLSQISFTQTGGSRRNFEAVSTLNCTPTLQKPCHHNARALEILALPVQEKAPWCLVLQTPSRNLQRNQRISRKRDRCVQAMLPYLPRTNATCTKEPANY